MTLAKEVTAEILLHIFTLAVILVLTAGASHLAGSKTCGQDHSHTAHAAHK